MGSIFLDFSLPKTFPLYSKMMSNFFFQKDEFLYGVPPKPFECDVSHLSITSKVRWKSLYMDNIFKKFRDPTKPIFHLSPVFLGVFDKNFHKIFNIFIFEIEELELHPPTLQVKYTLRWHISQALYQNNEFSKSSKDKKPFSDAQFFHFSVPKIIFFCLFGPWPINWARRDIQFWGVDFSIWIRIDWVMGIGSFCLTNCIITSLHRRFCPITAPLSAPY